ncbi:TetR/AcrR family transcriptional regulator [Chloroflexus sp. Y-396-1]|uniref:TetR/AcrR family transcriptional regulator n=1 Tax=Chloroflexus sp. Y-396-1 TaxID=867845 RepID=UPI00048D2113|nr:TetR/AcrR family transcriptional regulator [Chloroflexus sp. Y-396-1]
MPTETFFNLPEEKRTRLIDVLLDEFAENDYDSVSINRIAERAGIAKGSFYQYFADKKDCYLYLIQLGIEQKTAFLRQTPPSPDTDIFTYLRWLLDVGVQFQFHNPRLAQIAYRAIYDDVPLPTETMQVIRQGSYAYFKQLIAQGIAEGSINPAIDSETAAFMLNVVFTELGKYLIERFTVDPASLFQEGATVLLQPDLRRVIEQVIDILERGMRNR